MWGGNRKKIKWRVFHLCDNNNSSSSKKSEQKKINDNFNGILKKMESLGNLPND